MFCDLCCRSPEFTRSSSSALIEMTIAGRKIAIHWQVGFVDASILRCLLPVFFRVLVVQAWYMTLPGLSSHGFLAGPPKTLPAGFCAKKVFQVYGNQLQSKGNCSLQMARRTGSKCGWKKLRAITCNALLHGEDICLGTVWGRPFPPVPIGRTSFTNNFISTYNVELRE